MQRIAITAALLLVTAPAMAAETVVSLDRRDCARLVRYTPAPDVAYRPGVDAHGRKVVPADLGGTGEIALPTRFEIPIKVDLSDRLGIPPNGDADYIARFPVGAVTADEDGRIAFNGVPLTDDEAADLAARCQRVGAGR